MATKFVYTDVEVAEITVKYAAGITLEVLASTYNKSVPSVRMKLVKLGVYQKQEKPTTTKTANTATKKTSTTKSEILAEYEHALSLVGEARW